MTEPTEAAEMPAPRERVRAVLFDLGGVVLGSPLHAIVAYECERGVAPGTVNRTIADNAPHGAWQRLERGELKMGETFLRELDAELLDADLPLSAAEMMARIAEVTLPREAMLEAIVRLRRARYLVGALTNNWVYEDPDEEDTGRNRRLAPYFDRFVESQAVGLRKPDPRIYRLACEQLGVTPTETVFLDDIGANLKPARALGMTTIKVGSPEAALRELGEVLGLQLVGS